MSDRGRRCIALLLEYDGTAFAGSQSQPRVRTVQDTLEAALEKFTGERTRIAFAGRTDAGVHAMGQVAALHTSTGYSAATCREALNHFLPEDVVVRRAAEVAQEFDPRRHAGSRRYRYRIEDGRGRSPLMRHRAWQLERSLDASAMAEAAGLLPRESRDWAAFGGPVPEHYPTVRTLLACTVRRVEDREACAGEASRAEAPLLVTMEADGFLPHQVRRTVGALEQVGLGRMSPGEFAGLVEGAPGSAGPTAPPQGLTLVTVQYPPGTVDWDD